MVTFANNLVFLSSGDAVQPNPLNFAWTERQCHACKTPPTMYPSIYNSFPVIRTTNAKIAIFTYTGLHFCLPWGRPCGNHAKRCMNENTIQCKPLAACTHLSSTVSQLFEPQVQKIAVFTYRSPHFCFPSRRPCDYHAICCMDGKTIQCLPNSSQHVCTYLSSIVSVFYDA